MNSFLLVICGAFYCLLCVFSIVTGLIYFSGKRKLNPLELSEKFISRFDTDEKINSFAKRMGIVTFIVGIVQGITSYCISFGNNPIHYYISLGFTIFSIGSVSIKLKGKINAFPIIKAIAYISILIILILPSSRLYFYR